MKEENIQIKEENILEKLKGEGLDLKRKFDSDCVIGAKPFLGKIYPCQFIAILVDMSSKKTKLGSMDKRITDVGVFCEEKKKNIVGVGNFREGALDILDLNEYSKGEFKVKKSIIKSNKRTKWINFFLEQVYKDLEVEYKGLFGLKGKIENVYITMENKVNPKMISIKDHKENLFVQVKEHAKSIGYEEIFGYFPKKEKKKSKSEAIPAETENTKQPPTLGHKKRKEHMNETDSPSKSRKIGKDIEENNTNINAINDISHLDNNTNNVNNSQSTTTKQSEKENDSFLVDYADPKESREQIFFKLRNQKKIYIKKRSVNQASVYWLHENLNFCFEIKEKYMPKVEDRAQWSVKKINSQLSLIKNLLPLSYIGNEDLVHQQVIELQFVVTPKEGFKFIFHFFNNFNEPRQMIFSVGFEGLKIAGSETIYTFEKLKSHALINLIKF